MDKRLMKKMQEEKRDLLDIFARTEMAHLSKKTVMLVDDSDESINIMTAFLNRSAELKIQAFTDEFEALKMISNSSPDLIVLDVMLTSFDGIKFASFVKELGMYTGPIVFVSANPKFRDEVKHVINEKCSFFSKPIDSEKFTKTIIKLLEK